MRVFEADGTVGSRLPVVLTDAHRELRSPHFTQEVVKRRGPQEYPELSRDTLARSVFRAAPCQAMQQCGALHTSGVAHAGVPNFLVVRPGKWRRPFPAAAASRCRGPSSPLVQRPRCHADRPGRRRTSQRRRHTRSHAPSRRRRYLSASYPHDKWAYQNAAAAAAPSFRPCQRPLRGHPRCAVPARPAMDDLLDARVWCRSGTVVAAWPPSGSCLTSGLAPAAARAPGLSILVNSKRDSFCGGYGRLCHLNCRKMRSTARKNSNTKELVVINLKP